MYINHNMYAYNVSDSLWMHLLTSIYKTICKKASRLSTASFFLNMYYKQLNIYPVYDFNKYNIF